MMPQRPASKQAKRGSPPSIVPPPSRAGHHPDVRPATAAAGRSTTPISPHRPGPTSSTPSPRSSFGSANNARMTPPATPDPLVSEMRYRHLLELQAVKRQTLELREEKAFLVAQNFRLHRELVHEKHHHLPGAPPGSASQRDSSRPAFSRSASHPNADFPRGGLAALSQITTSSGRPASIAAPSLTPTSRPRTPSSASSMHPPRPHHQQHPSLDGSHQFPTSGGSDGYPFPLSRRSSMSTMSGAPDPANLSRPASLRSTRSRTGSFASSCGGRTTPASSIASVSNAIPTPLTAAGPNAAGAAAARGRPPSRPAHHGPSGSSDNLKGILKPPRSSSREAGLNRAPSREGRRGYVLEEGYESAASTVGNPGQRQPPMGPPSGPRRRVSMGAAGDRTRRPAMVTSF